jgi:oligopeptidase B
MLVQNHNTLYEKNDLLSNLHIQPPRARKEVATLVLPHGGTVVDEYHWLRDDTRTNPEVLAYLKAENDYAEAVINNSELKNAKAILYEELISRERNIVEPHAPWRMGSYLYYRKTLPDKNNDKAYFYRREAEDGEEELLIDPNEVDGDIHFIEVSPDHNYLAFGYDKSGNERYTLALKDTSTGVIIKNYLTNLGSVEDPWNILRWSANSEYFLYLCLDKEGRAKKLWRHKLRTDPATCDELLYVEDDEAYALALHTTHNQKYFLLVATSGCSTEIWGLETDNPTGQFQCLLPRKKNVIYWLEHHGDYFYIGTNENAVNFMIYQCHVTDIGNPSKWRVVLPHDEDRCIINMDTFANYFVVYEQRQCQKLFRVVELDRVGGNEAHIDFTRHSYFIDFPETVYSVTPGNVDDNRGHLISRDKSHCDFNGASLIYTYSSLTTPRQVIEYDFVTKTSWVLWELTIPHYNPENYTAERLYAPSHDGTLVPISLVYHKQHRQPNKPNPCLLVGYGAYSQSKEPRFSSDELCLLDRGVIYAIAHVRGGTEMGWMWYEEGKGLHKRNSFLDFIACAEFLIQKNYTESSKLCVYGRSAGGLLVCASTNMRPDLWKAVIAEVPFVDVLRNMSDPSVPWTTFEYAEWGNPNDPEVYEYIKSYCPMTNIKRQCYPHMLVTAGFNDSRVLFWEPAKFVAKLRDHKTDNNLLLFITKMGMGHFVGGGLAQRLNDVALKWAFILTVLEIPVQP